jgi:hypothetical protein
MSAEDILDKWFGGPEGKSKNVNPRELLKELPPVSLGGRRDYATAIELGNKRGTKLELKYPSWGLYPRHELAELLIMVRIDFIRQLIAGYEQRHTKADIAAALNIPQSQIEQNKKVSKSMADFFKGPLA